MVIFLVTVAPLWYFLVISLYKIPARGWKGILMPWFKGLLLGMLALLVTLALLTRFPFDMDFSQLYRWAWLRGTGWGLLPCVVAVLLIEPLKPSHHSRIRIISGWLSGTATVYMIWTSLTLGSGFEIYRFFLTPFIWISTIGLVSFLIDRGGRINHWIRYPIWIGAFIVPSLFTFIPVLFFQGEKLTAWILAVVLTIGSSFLALLDAKGLC